MNILIIGYGRVGKEITKNLATLDFIKNIFIVDKAQSKIQNKKKLKFIENFNNLDLDYILITLSATLKNKWEQMLNNEKDLFSLIQKELKYNLPEIKILVKKLKKLPLKTKIIVVTNPSDKITNYLKKQLRQEVIGFGGELDAFRYKNQIGKKVFCIGLHNQCIPLVNSKSKEKIQSLIKKSSDNVMNQLRKLKMTHSFTGKMFRKFFIKLNSNKKSIVHMCYSKNEKYSITQPLYVKKGKIISRVPVKINSLEKRLLNEIIAKDLS